MSMFPIATFTATSSAVNVYTFSNIPQNFTHLQVRATLRSVASNPVATTYFQFTGTPGAGYNHILYGDGSSAASSNAGPLNYGSNFQMSPGGTSNANFWLAEITDILDYSNTSRNKTIKRFGGFEDGTRGRIYLNSYLYAATTAIDSVTISTDTGFAVGTTFTLYGINSSTVTGA